MDFDVKPTLDGISLYYFTSGLIARLILDGSEVPNENGDWHELFYDIKNEERDVKPKFLNELQFDWDGSYPKSPHLSEFFQALNVVDLARSPRGKIVIDEKVVNDWMQQVGNYSLELKYYFDYTVERAREYLMH